MAVTSLAGGGTELPFIDKRRVHNATAESVATPANYASVAAKRARLTTINAGYFTAAMLNIMSANDMDYAIRLADDLAGV